MSNLEPATILLIDDHPMLRTGVKQLVSMAPDITVVGEASNGEEAVRLAGEIRPDLVFLDVNMPVMNGIEALERNKAGVDAVFARLDEAAESSPRSSPRVARAMQNLAMALRVSLQGERADEAKIDAIVAAIDEAAARVEKA